MIRLFTKHFEIVQIVCLLHQFLRHAFGINNNNIGYISNLPANMSSISTIFDNTENCAKLPVGPTTLSPGPILLNVAATDVKLVTASKLSKLIIKSETINIKT